jgi:hypothetical protein
MRYAVFMIFSDIKGGRRGLMRFALSAATLDSCGAHLGKRAVLAGMVEQIPE